MGNIFLTKNFNKKGDVLKIPLFVKDFCSYCPYNRGFSCTYKKDHSTNETCEIRVSKRTITLK